MRPVPRRPSAHVLPVAPEWLAEVWARVERIGVARVAAAAGLKPKTLDRVLRGKEGRRPNVDTLERIRLAVHRLEPGQPESPPPVVAVKGRAHADWIAMADQLSDADLARAVANPRATLRAVRARK
jgi:hypothetical protein